MSGTGPDTEIHGRVEVSVIVPVFNAAAHIAEQLEALARQTFPGRWEVVLADNGSTDASMDIARCREDVLDLRIVDASDRGGPGHARNVGAAAARGEWLAFCDADDVVEPGWLAALHASRGHADLVAGAIRVDTLNTPAMAHARGGAALVDRLPDGPAGFLPYAPSGNLLVRRELFQQLGGWDETLRHCEDVDFSWRAQLAGHTLAVAPGAVLHYRFRGTPLGVYHQTRRYKAAEAVLYRRFRGAGARRRPARRALRTVWWLLSRSPYVVLGEERRYLWFTLLGEAVGHVEGSVDQRVLYL
ncbi:glycosyltransferase family A protein [Terrabacter aerolatus]|uniref:Glycosyl transferase n=1 Tax=Terrabacter aerolatus TaxID=422442 RepID=A0A512D3Q7_9MICO|nr:glycosyltransferase family A protein [Terrabacter aerolatus]GEO31082.1 glycosyl transferase [Terrabacter aerolatus]